MKWSEEVIAFLAVTDYQKAYTTRHGSSLRRHWERGHVQKHQLRHHGRDQDKDQCSGHEGSRSSKSSCWKQASRSSGSQQRETQDLVAEVTSLKHRFGQKKSSLIKADFFLWYSLLHATSGDPNVMVRRITRTSNSDSGAVAGLEIWRQVTHQSIRSVIKHQDGFVAQADHVICWVECREVKGYPSAISSLVGAHFKAWSALWWKDHRHCQDHFSSSECQRQSCSVFECQR